MYINSWSSSALCFSDPTPSSPSLENVVIIDKRLQPNPVALRGAFHQSLLEIKAKLLSGHMTRILMKFGLGTILGVESKNMKKFCFENEFITITF